MTAILARLERRWLPVALGLLLLVTGLSLIPKAQMPEAAEAHDKVEHLLAYAAIVLPVAFARPRRWIAITAGVVAWSAAIEFVQPLVNRARSFEDFLTNLAGVALGVACAAALRRLR